MNTPPATYTVQVDDNFHYMDQCHQGKGTGVRA